MACSYWKRKQAVMNSDIAVITFSMMIVDGMIPVTAGEDGMQISFDDRDMVVIDEAHGLVEQTREMHAGFDVTPYGLPKRVFNGVTDSVDWDVSSFEDVRSECEELKARCKSFIRDDVLPMNYTPEEQRCQQIVENIKRAIRDTNNDSHWVVNVEGKNYGSNYVKVLELRPIYVGNFLNNFVWNRGDKRVISTATLRQRKNPEIWVQQLGLDPSKTEIINVGMTFEPSNRPVILDEMVCSMSNNGDEKNWDAIMNKLDDITKRFHNEKGICHTASYDRAKEVEDTVDPEKHPYLHDNLFVHYGEKDASVVIEEWQASDNDLLLSPSLMEGIDLKDDKGRYNILMKVPYPSHDSVTNYLLNETSWGWNSYFDRAAVRVAQAYGRTTRSPDDWSNFFVLDKDYEKLKKKSQLPRWLLQAEGYEEIGGRSVFDY
jgi:Rad3-related DNA helicase